MLDAPEAAGYYSWTFNIRLPGGLSIFSGTPGENGLSMDRKEVDVLGTTIIAQRSLVRMSGGPNYIKVRSPDVLHVDQDAFLVSPEMKQSLEAFTAEYRRMSGERDYLISFNDMSLPAGGLFDIAGEWTHPHRSHRKGRDADLNTVPGNAEPGYVPPPCEDDRLLHRAVEVALEPLEQRSSPILCESGNRRHLDFSPIRKESL